MQSTQQSVTGILGFIARQVMGNFGVSVVLTGYPVTYMVNVEKKYRFVSTLSWNRIN